MLLLSQVLAEINDKGRLIYLNKLLWNINNHTLIKTMMIIQHHTDTKCSLREWNPRWYPTFRVTEESKIMIRGNCNDYAVALICMSQTSHIRLLDTVAYAYTNMRHERIILWFQAPLTPKLLAQIVEKINKFKFAQMIILETVHNDNELVKYLRLKLYPTPTFIAIENELNLKGPFFHKEKFNAYGATFNVQSSDKRIALYLPKKNKEPLPGIRVEDREIFEFAKKYNMSIKLVKNNQNNNEQVDISLDTYFITKNTSTAQLDFSTPFGSDTLIIIVPCRKAMSLKEIFQYIDSGTWFMYTIYVYAILIVMEGLIQIANCRIHGRRLGLTWMVIVNLRAFRSLLGMSFPIRRRTSLSLKQFFMAMSIFGMVFSSFFSCKLTSLMTKHSLKAEVTNMEELRASGLTVLSDLRIRDLIESQWDPEYFHKTIPKIEYFPFRIRHDLFLSLNNTYAQIILKENWPMLDKYQLSMGRKAFCTSRDLGIFNTLPKVHLTLENSAIKKLLSKFLFRTQEGGIQQKWTRDAIRASVKGMNLIKKRTIEPGAMPLSVNHLMWTGYVLVFGHVLAAIVFLLEVLLHRRQNQRTRPANHDNMA